MSMNKKAVSIPIAILVLTSLVLSIISLSFFLIKQENVKSIFRGANEIDEAYLKGQILNFYVQDIFDKSVVAINSDSGKQVFIDNFRNELIGYKDKNGRYPVNELAFVELKVLEEDIANRVEISGEKLIFRLDLKVRKAFVSKNDYVSVDYSYVKEFEKVFK